MTKKTEAPEEIEQAEQPELSHIPELPVDFRDQRIEELEKQVRALENFANIVVGQRNEAQNQAAQFQAQLQGVLHNNNKEIKI